MATTKATPKATVPAVKYVCPAGVRHVDVIRGLLQSGATPAGILAGYVEARLPEFKARKAYKAREADEVRKLLTKHGRTHLALAMSVMNPASIEEQLDRANQAAARAQKTLDAAKARQANALAAKKATQQVAKAS